MKKVFLFVVASLLVSVQLVKANPAFSVTVVGKGEPVLFFPGFACPGELWQETVAEVSKQYKCHAFTFAGFGTVPPIEKPWLPKIQAAAMEYVQQKQLHKAVLVGHSLGGTLALWMAATKPELFAKVIAIDALPCNGAVMMPNYNAAAMSYDNPYSRQMLQQDSASFRAAAAQQAAFMMKLQHRQQQVVNWMMQADRNTYVYGYIDLLKVDLRKDMANITIPVVILAATSPSKAMVAKTYNEQYALLANKQIFYADQSAHFIMYDQPEWMMQQLKQNLQ